MQHALRMHLMPPNFSRLRIPKDVKRGMDPTHCVQTMACIHHVREWLCMK